MEPITIITLANLLSPFLLEAGKEVSKQAVQTLFSSRGDLAEKFANLFKTEILTLGLNDSGSDQGVASALDRNLEIKRHIEVKLTENEHLVNELITALSQQTGRTINAKTYIESARDITIY